MNSVTRQHTALPVTQRGAVVLLLLIIIATSTATYFFVHELNNTRLQIERDKTNAAALAQARDAVLGFALANQDMPGGLPFPDRNGDGNYDGNGDCVTYGFSSSHLLGKLPFLNEVGCGNDRAFDIAPTDANGEHLWYAASQNLIKSVGGHFPSPVNTYTLMSSGGWLTVVSESGAILSNQIAFLLIAPGGVLAGQNRSSIAPNANNYLDKFTVGAITYDNANGTNSPGFITARPVNNATNRFNDRLLYVTRLEFINQLVLRIVGEIRLRLDQYHTAYNRYPFAAPASDGVCVYDAPSGFIPTTNGNCGGALAAFPSWWTVHKWQDYTYYTYTSANQVTIQFDSCASKFIIAWNALLNRSEMSRSNSC